ncbi:MAG: tRNA pseudouridine(38-40) synthase TruA [Gammaproteobacteria bacterium]|nr:MAG: tRNA pseudouridine(38-40) synthase TruA [Gammaproteobacteria bacterium]
MKLAACVEYDGTDFHGWQTQSSGCRTVQSEIEAAISKVANEPVAVTCSGRTDKGVHGFGQVIHFETNAIRDERSWTLGITTNLPRDIGVSWVMPVKDDFNARFSALSRRYRYVIYQSMVRPSILRHRVCWSCRRLDAMLMHKGAQHLLGEHDFSSFRAAECQAAHPLRDMQFVDVSSEGDYIYIDIQANAFLHHMVRNIAGVLIQVGEGRQDSPWVKQVLEARDRTAADITAPAQGLYFVSVKYPDEYLIPESSLRPIFA